MPACSRTWRSQSVRTTCRCIASRRISLVAASAMNDLLHRTSELKAKLDERSFPKGVEVTDEELAEVNLIKEAFHGESNYTIAPGRRRES